MKLEVFPLEAGTLEAHLEDINYYLTGFSSNAINISKYKDKLLRHCKTYIYIPSGQMDICSEKFLRLVYDYPNQIYDVDNEKMVTIGTFCKNNNHILCTDLSAIKEVYGDYYYNDQEVYINISHDKIPKDLINITYVIKHNSHRAFNNKIRGMEHSYKFNPIKEGVLCTNIVTGSLSQWKSFIDEYLNKEITLLGKVAFKVLQHLDKLNNE